ncbi:adenosylcobinamide-phosphate synthase CbiB [uncultured Amaricoccus sp.]|uniref:adenosylcobinamide-phosphate synthase CbiB n=1 Tax=uncultured Amaricoccus sp. TaxID=339341 RepID=UPI002612E950|nr:adenosylcobinamide-phosphate synthase CbiB [uncultured Amaricoccus sp.]
MFSPLPALLAMLAELLTGYPDPIYRAIGHPVTWFGRLISALERWWNRGPGRRRRLLGIVTAAALTLAGLVPGLALERALPGWLGQMAVALLAGTLIAQRSLGAHVAAVATALERGLPEGRAAVSRIVGRDPDSLDAAGVARAAIESLAENFSDGVVAPVFWLWVGGLGGGAAYKAINTGDSMIGHRSERYRAFGWAVARLDDLVNLPASRLTAALLIGAACVTPGASPRGALRAVRRDAGRHRSPNAGWPEAAMAGALGFALAGPRRYGGELVEDAVMGAGGRPELGAADIRRALRLYWTADALLVGLLAGLSLPV